MATGQRILSVQSVQVAGSQLSMRFRFQKYCFSLSYWYDFDLELLNGMYDYNFMEKVYAHCAAFSIFHLCGLNPDVLDWGPCSRWHTAEFERVWKTAWKGLSGQWRFQNELPHAKPPFFASEASPPTSPVSVEPNDHSTTLAFFGGGKDSLVMYELLSRAGIPFSTVLYSHTIYGRHALQQQLGDKVLELLKPPHISHKLCMLDDFLESPVLESLGKQLGIKSFIEFEGPACLFAALPLVLYYGYTSIAIGNERSSNVGNLVWDITGEEINHQWGKSKQSEILFCDYIQQALISNVHYFSILQPIYDGIIFSVAESRKDVAMHTHSCNVDKPWCKRCPKCCYVWLMFMAYFPCDVVNVMFQGENLLNIPENEIHFIQMLGLGTNKPFECIGEIDEARLGFEVCRCKGVQGHAMEIYKAKLLHTVDSTTWAAIIEKYTNVYTSESTNIPSAMWKKLLPILQQAADDARCKLKAALL